MTVVLAMALFGLVRIGPARADDALRCDKRLISVGETALELRKLCGTPDHVASYPELNGSGVVGADGSSILRYVQEEVEIWTYTNGPGDLVRLIQIRRGKIRQITAISRLSVPKTPGCQKTVLRDRATTGEVFVACGVPMDESRWVEEERVRNAKGVEIRRLVTKERWIYDPGPGNLLRILDFENGRLIRIETGRRSRSG